MEEAGGFEFGTTHNVLIGTLAGKMKWVSYFLFLAAALYLLASLLAFQAFGAGGIVQAAIMALIGLYTKKAADAFGQIVHTTGRDINHLMDALEELKRLYTLQFWVFIIAVILIAIGLIFVLMSSI